jgi:hypothetical protein
MGDQARRYFVMSKEKSSAFMAEFRDAKAPRQEAYKKLMEKYQADNLMVSRSDFSGERVQALIFKEMPEQRRGWKLEETILDGEWGWKASPNRRFKEGKQLACDISAVNNVDAASLFSPWAIERLKMGTLVFSSGFMSHAVAGYVKDQVVVAVPVPNLEQEEFPEIHSDLIEIKKSQFVALTEE